MNTATRRAYQEKAEAEMRVWNARIEELLARADAKKASGKIAYQKRLENLREQRDQVRRQLANLREASSDAWNELQEGFEQALQEMTTTFHSALDRLRGDDDGDAPAQRPKSDQTADRGVSVGG